MAMASSTPTPRRRHTAAAANTVGVWAAVSAADEWRVEEEVGKHQLMRRTGLPARDLRALAPPLAHPSASILGRDRAVVVCLDGVRAVVTASEVLVPGPRDPAAAQLVRDLLTRLGGGSAPTPTASPAPPQVVTVRLSPPSLRASRPRLRRRWL
jgi:magnesium transporter